MKTVLLTFDVEECDFLSPPLSLEVSARGVQNIMLLLDNHHVTSTCFVTGVFAENQQDLVGKLSQKHEIASHGYRHADDYNAMDDDVLHDKLSKTNSILSTITGTKIGGFRAPRFSRINLNVLKKLSFIYDSSINPTFIPGRYNSFSHTRDIAYKDGILEVPLSTTPLLRLPLFWLAFKNFGMRYAKYVTQSCLSDMDFVHLVFHPWEFVDLSKYRVPFVYKPNTGERLIKKLDHYISWCKNKGMKFSTIHRYLDR